MNYKCNMCDNMGLRQNCNEHRTVHGHGMVHLDKIFIYLTILNLAKLNNNVFSPTNLKFTTAFC